MQLFVQTVPRHASWLLVGPPAATSLVPQQDITVTFSDSSSVVVPAGVPAQLPGGGTTWDRTQEVVVGYVVQGSGTLLACLESQLAGLGADYAPLVRVLVDSVQVYQPQQPSGEAIKAGAWSGGAFIGVGRAISGGGYYGVFDAQSIQGGGSVSGVPWYVNTGPGNSGGTCFGFYVKVATLPASDTTLVDLNGGANGYLRCKLTSTGHIIAEMTAQSVAGSLDVSAGAIATATWYWVTVRTLAFSSNGFRLEGQVTAAGGSSAGVQGANFATSGFVTTQYTATLGWGVHQSTGYLDFPNSVGNELSKLALKHTVNGGGYPALFSPPGTDMSAAGLDALYLCRQAVGTVSGTLTDSTGNAFNLTPGASGMAIMSDGPY